MRFECDITGIDPQPHLLAFFRRVLDHAADRVALDKGTVGRIIIASDDRFGPAVRSIKPGGRGTQTPGPLWRVGRPSRGETATVSCRTSYCGADPLRDLVDVLGDPPTSNDWGVGQQRGPLHRLPRVRPRSSPLRGDTARHPRALGGKPLLDQRHCQVLRRGSFLTEYAACRNAGLGLTGPAVQQRDAGNRRPDGRVPEAGEPLPRQPRRATPGRWPTSSARARGSSWLNLPSCTAMSVATRSEPRQCGM